MLIDVTTAARRAEPTGTVASAVSVITGDDIRRAGVTTIAEALRLATGVHVARLNNGSWRISARGFNGDTPNKLLVMIDGRTVYSPLFTGVFWNTLDYVLEDIDRIEVIRGPGAALWGANAVNGVVNIITRHARDTQGTYAALTAGNEDRAIAEIRHGTALGGAYWRAYAKIADHAAQRFATGASAQDARRHGQAGFRIDGGSRQATSWLLKGDAFHSRDSFPDRPEGEFTDLALQAGWGTALSPTSRVDVQSYYRREYRRVPLQLTHYINIFDLDAQHESMPAARHHVVWGGGLRVNRDRTHGSALIKFDPPQRTYPILSAFVQDEITLRPERLFVTLGAKYEHNAFSGGELQPNVRARWLLARRQTLWGGVSRAVRRPTRLDDDAIVTGPGGTVLIRGTGAFEAESFLAYGIGYRIQPVAAIAVDITGFRHDVRNLRSQDLPPAGSLPLLLGNSLEGHSHGVELSVTVQPLDRWRTHIGYTWLDTVIRRVPGSRDVSGGIAEANDPRHLVGLRTSLELRPTVELDAMFRSVGELPNPHVPGYTELNLRLGWRATPNVELSLTGQDLLHDRHAEAGPLLPTRVEFERAVRLGVAFRF